MAKLEEGHINNGVLPPLTDLFLEIQVHKLIQEYLFSSIAGEMCTSLYSEASEHKASDRLYAADMALVRSVCNVPCVKSTTDKQSPHDPHRKPSSQASSTLHRITCIEDYGMPGYKDQTATGNALQTASRAHEASLATTESGGSMMPKTAHLSRVGTFPCTGNVQLQVGVPSKAKLEIKGSCKKPPRPPKVPKSELSLSLTRCCSDNGAYSQSARRERRRKITGTATSNVYTSILALLFTFCFAIIMIAQGFGSQDSQNFSAYSSDASSPMQTFMRESSKRPPEETSLAGPVEREASMEGVLADDVLAQSYVMRKVLLQPLSDTKSSTEESFIPLSRAFLAYPDPREK